MVVYLDYSVSSGPFLSFSMRFKFLSEMFDHSVCETRDPSLTILLSYFNFHPVLYCHSLGGIQSRNIKMPH